MNVYYIFYLEYFLNRWRLVPGCGFN